MIFGTGIDIATGAVTHPKTTELITLVHPKTGVAQDLIWREGMNIYTARRALDIRSAPSTFKLIRNKKSHCLRKKSHFFHARCHCTPVYGPNS